MILDLSGRADNIERIIPRSMHGMKWCVQRSEALTIRSKAGRGKFHDNEMNTCHGQPPFGVDHGLQHGRDLNDNHTYTYLYLYVTYISTRYFRANIEERISRDTRNL